MRIMFLLHVKNIFMIFFKDRKKSYRLQLIVHKVYKHLIYLAFFSTIVTVFY